MYKQNKVKWKGKGSYNHNSHYGVKKYQEMKS